MTQKPRKARLFGRGLLIALGGITALIWLAYQFTFGDIAERRALANLVRSPLANHLPIPIAELDIIAFQDGREGLFIVTDTAQIQSAQIGFFGPRLMGQIFGGSHDPIHCGAGKSLYAVKDNNSVRDLGYCSRRRMDFAELRPFAEPAEWKRENLAVQSVLPRIAEITANPDQYMTQAPHYIPELDYTFTVTTPYHWTPNNADLPQAHIIHTAIEDAFAATLPEGETRYRTYIHYEVAYETPPQFDQDWTKTEIERPIIRADNQDYVMPTLQRIARYTIDVHCISETCPALSTADLSPVFTSDRDSAVLDAAFNARIPTDYVAATIPPPNPVTLATLTDSETVATDPKLIMLNITYVQATAR